MNVLVDTCMRVHTHTQTEQETNLISVLLHDISVGYSSAFCSVLGETEGAYNLKHSTCKGKSKRMPGPLQK